MAKRTQLNEVIAQGALARLHNRARVVNADDDRLHEKDDLPHQIVSAREDAEREVNRISADYPQGPIRRVDVHVLAHFDSEHDRVARTGLPADQQALLLAAILRTGLGVDRDLDVDAQRAFAEKALQNPLRASWRSEPNGLYLTTRGYSLDARLHVRQQFAVRRSDFQEFFVRRDDWAVARGVVASAAGTLKAVIVPLAREGTESEIDAGARVLEVLEAVFEHRSGGVLGPAL